MASAWRKAQGAGGVKRGSQLEKDLDTLGKKKRKAREKKVKEGLKKAFPPDRRSPGKRATPRTRSQIQLKIADLRVSMREAQKSGNKKATATYRKTIAVYKERLAKLSKEK